MDDLGLVEVRGSSKPAAVLMRAKDYLLVAECSGLDDLSIRIVRENDLYQKAIWEKHFPVARQLLEKVAKVSLIRHEKKLGPVIHKFMALTSKDKAPIPICV